MKMKKKQNLVAMFLNEVWFIKLCEKGKLRA